MLPLLLALLTFQIPSAPKGLVSDYAGALAPGEVAALQAQLLGTRIAVAVFPSLEGEEPSDLTARIGEKWGLGEKREQNGVLLALYIQERKWSIQVGYGAEGVLTDAQAAIVGHETLVPHLRAGHLAQGIAATTQRIKNILDRKAVAPRPRRAKSTGRGSGFILFMVILVIFFMSRARRRGVLGGGGWMWLPFLGGWGGGGRQHDDDHWGGGGFGGGGGGGDFGGGGFGGGGASKN